MPLTIESQQMAFCETPETTGAMAICLGTVDVKGESLVVDMCAAVCPLVN